MSKPAPDDAPPAPGSATPSREMLRTASLLALTVLTLYLGWKLLLPYVVPLIWALALAVVTRPLHRRIARRVKKPGLAAGLAVFIVAVCIVAPTLFVARELFTQATEGVKTLQAEVKEGKLQAKLQQNPRLAPLLKAVEQRGGTDAASQVFSGVGARIPAVIGVSARGLMEAAIALFALFFMFRDEQKALRMVRSLLPLRRREATLLLRRIHDTIWATMFGTVVMGAVQGVLGGLAFMVLGLPAPVLWGMVMAFLAIIPVLGAFIVCVPAAILLAVQGEVGKAAALAVMGAIVVSGSDNVLYPVLVGKRMRMHTLPVFVALLGGLSLCGAVGIVVGPVTLAVAMVLLRIWRRRTARDANVSARAASPADRPAVPPV